MALVFQVFLRTSIKRISTERTLNNSWSSRAGLFWGAKVHLEGLPWRIIICCRINILLHIHVIQVLTLRDCISKLLWGSILIFMRRIQLPHRDLVHEGHRSAGAWCALGYLYRRCRVVLSVVLLRLVPWSWHLWWLWRLFCHFLAILITFGVFLWLICWYLVYFDRFEVPGVARIWLVDTLILLRSRD